MQSAHAMVVPTLDLVELGKVGAVDGLIAEHPVHAEVLGRPEALLRVGGCLRDGSVWKGQ